MALLQNFRHLLKKWKHRNKDNTNKLITYLPLCIVISIVGAFLALQFKLPIYLDTIGTFIGTGKKAGIFKVDEEGNMPKNLEKAMITDSVATVIGSLLGTSNLGTFVESSVGIETGGRTGLTAVFVALLFALSLFISPLVACVPMAAIAPVLILIGVSMIQNVANIDWKDILIAIPAFFIIIMMPFSYSITTGIEFGFMFYALISIANKKAKEVSPMIYIFTLLFIIEFVYNIVA